MIFWPEAGREIGLGHVMECLALANVCRDKGTDAHFVFQNFAGAAAQIDGAGFTYSTALMEDGVDLIESRAKGKGWVVVDHRSADIANLRRLRRKGHKVLVIDQLGKKDISADVLINPSIVEDWLQYRFPDGQPVCCFGPEFALLRDEFIDVPDRARGGDTLRVLVTMGGVDRTGVTMRIVEAILSLGLTAEIDIVIGSGFPHMDDLLRLVRGQEHRFTVACGVNDMAARMSRADLAFSAGGNTLYELARTGTPAIVLWEDPHEEILGHAFARRGTCVCVGRGAEVPVDVIAEHLRVLLNEPMQRSRMRNEARDLVDGRGAERVCGILSPQSPDGGLA